jgi:pimeloyl-ACP methyl ester carboxylesterase
MNKRPIFIAFLIFVFSAGAVAQAPQEKFVTLFGAKVRYLEAGDVSKPTVILLHGLGGNADLGWGFNIGAISAKYHVLAPDQIGFGKSDKPVMNYRVGTYVDFLDKFMTELKIEKASLVGNSMGGWIAGLYAAKYPARVDKLVLVDAAGYAPAKGFDYRLLQGLAPSTRDGVRSMVKLILYNSDMFMSDAAVDSFITARIAANDSFTVMALLKTIELGEDYFDNQVKGIKLPTLIVWGKQDGLTPVSEGERLKKDIAGSELVVFDKCGHIPQAEKAPEFNAAVMTFLEKK